MEQSDQPQKGKTDQDTGRISSLEHQLEDRLTEKTDELEPRIRRFQRTWLGRLITNFVNDDADGMATHIAFNAVFSLLPILMVIVTLAGFIARQLGRRSLIQEWLVEVLPEELVQPMLDFIYSTQAGAAQLGLVSAVLVLYGGNRLFNSLDRAFARIYRTERRQYFLRKVVAVLMMPILGLLIITAIVIATATTVLLTIPANFLFSTNSTHSATIAGYLIALLVTSTITTLLYVFLPAVPKRFRQALPGILIVTPSMLLLTQLFPVYIYLVDGYSMYGRVFAFMFFLLIWLYLQAQLIILGAEINALRAGYRPLRPDQE